MMEESRGAVPDKADAVEAAVRRHTAMIRRSVWTPLATGRWWTQQCGEYGMDAVRPRVSPPILAWSLLFRRTLVERASMKSGEERKQEGQELADSADFAVRLVRADGEGFLGALLLDESGIDEVNDEEQWPSRERVPLLRRDLALLVTVLASAMRTTATSGASAQRGGQKGPDSEKAWAAVWTLALARFLLTEPSVAKVGAVVRGVVNVLSSSAVSGPDGPPSIPIMELVPPSVDQWQLVGGASSGENSGAEPRGGQYFRGMREFPRIGVEPTSNRSTTDSNSSSRSSSSSGAAEPVIGDAVVSIEDLDAMSLAECGEFVAFVRWWVARQPQNDASRVVYNICRLLKRRHELGQWSYPPLTETQISQDVPQLQEVVRLATEAASATASVDGDGKETDGNVQDAVEVFQQPSPSSADEDEVAEAPR